MCMMLLRLWYGEKNELMIYVMVTELITMVECLLLYMISRHLFEFREHRKKFYYMAIVIEMIISVMFDLFNVSELLGIIVLVFYETAFIMLIFDVKLVKVCLFCMMYNLSIMLIDMITYIFAISVMGINSDNILNVDFTHCILGIISKAVCTLAALILTRVIGDKRKYSYISVSVLGIPVICIFMMFVLLDYSLKIEFSNISCIIFYCSIGGILLLNISMFYICDKLEENQHRKYEILRLQNEKEFYEQIKNSYEMVKKVKHDYDKQINVMSVLLEKKQYDDLESFFHTYINDNRFRLVESYTGNILMDSIINQKIVVADEKNVDVQVISDNIIFDSMNPFYMCNALGNVIDNALEAASVYAGTEKGYVRIKIQNYEKLGIRHILISVANYCKSNDVDIEMTSKDDFDNHGYGIGNVQSSVTKMGGLCKFGVENNEFYALMLIPA